MTAMNRLVREEARLIILRALQAQQPSETLNSNIFVPELERYGILFSRAQVHGELEYLAGMDAITLAEADGLKIATLNELGARHLRRGCAIEGVKLPDRIGV